MPKETFLNLPADKRARFVDAALDEFCARPYDQASVTTIVARLGIAKGSVYQYFEDKADLFLWLLDEAARRKLSALGADASGAFGADATVPFLARLRAMYRSGLVFWQREPRWAQVSLRLLEPSTDARIDALRRASRERARMWMRGELAAAAARGELRADLDPDLAAALVLAVLQDGLLAALQTRAGVDLADPDAAARLAAVPAADVEAVTDAAMALLERGLARG